MLKVDGIHEISLQKDMADTDLRCSLHAVFSICPSLIRNKIQTAVMNIINLRILYNLTFRKDCFS